MPRKPVNKKLLFIGLPILIVGTLAAAYFWPSSTPLTYNYVPATVGDIKSEITASGIVKAAADVQLAFERAGKVNQSLVKVGDSVKAGQTLATLDATDLSAQLAQAQAAVSSAVAQRENAVAGYQAQVAKLQDMKNGASAPDLSLSQAQVSSAAQAVSDAQNNLNNINLQTQTAVASQYSHSVDLINGAYSSAFDAVNNQLAPLFSDMHTITPGLTFVTTNGQLESDVKNALATRESDLSDWHASLTSLDPNNQAATDSALSDALNRLNVFANFLRQINILLSEAVTTQSLSPSNLALYKTSANLGLSEINASILALNGQKQAIANLLASNDTALTQAANQLDQAKNALTVAQKALALKKSGATADQINAQTAAVSQAQAGIDGQTAAIAAAAANVQNFQAQLAKSILTSPLDGLVSQDDAKVGQIISPNIPVVSVISQAKYQIEVQVPESSIAQIKLGQTADVTLDAFGPNQIFKARVIAIDPAATVIAGVSGYKVTLEFSLAYPEIKAGLSANTQIIIAENPSAIIIPASAVIQRGSHDYVIVDNGTATGAEREVTTGLVDLNGRIEITSGLQAGERIATFGTPLN